VTGGAEVVGRDRPMPSATFDGITMINFGMGSANAATVMDLLSPIGAARPCCSSASAAG
jgi:AMP nucleosidase